MKLKLNNFQMQANNERDGQRKKRRWTLSSFKVEYELEAEVKVLNIPSYNWGIWVEAWATEIWLCQ